MTHLNPVNLRKAALCAGAVAVSCDGVRRPSSREPSFGSVALREQRGVRPPSLSLVQPAAFDGFAPAAAVARPPASCADPVRPPGAVPSRWDVLHKLSQDVEDFEEFSRSRYGDRGALFLRSLRSIHPRMEALIVHAGIVQRLDRFAEFAKTRRLTDPQEALRRFSEHLGARTFYRGLSVSEPTALSLRAEGLKCEAWRHAWAETPSVYELLGGTTKYNLESYIGYDRLRTHCSQFLGVSPSKSYAAEMGWLFSRAHPIDALLGLASSSSDPIYVFTLRVPEVETVYNHRDHLFCHMGSPKELEQNVPIAVDSSEIVACERHPMNWLRFVLGGVCRTLTLRTSSSPSLMPVEQMAERLRVKDCEGQL